MMKFINASFQIVSAITFFSLFINFINFVFVNNTNEILNKLTLNIFLIGLFIYILLGAIKISLDFFKHIKGL